MTAQVHQFPTDMDRLAAIAKEIQQELATASRNALESAILIGERLIEAKRIAGHGNFTPWLEQNFHASPEQARKYMSAARNAEALRSKGNSELPFALDMIPSLLRLPDDPEEQEEVVQTAIKDELAGVSKPTKAQVRQAVSKATAKPRDRAGTKIGAALDALRKAGPEGLSRSEVIAAGGLRGGAGLDRQVVTGEMVKADGRFYAPEFAPAGAPILQPAGPLPEISMTARQKLEILDRKREAEFQYRVNQAAQKLFIENHLPRLEEKLDKLKQMLSWPQYSVMTKAEYNHIRFCLHEDTRHSRTPEQLNAACHILDKYKLKLINDKEERENALRHLRSNLPTREEMLARLKGKRS